MFVGWSDSFVEVNHSVYQYAYELCKTGMPGALGGISVPADSYREVAFLVPDGLRQLGAVLLNAGSHIGNEVQIKNIHLPETNLPADWICRLDLYNPLTETSTFMPSISVLFGIKYISIS